MRATTIVPSLLVLSAAMSPLWADSPITSTHFCEAYMDYPIVVTAGESGVMTEEIARYLAADNPLDVKAAVINALSWQFEGKDNTALYCELRYPLTDGPPDVDDLGGHEAFVLAYLNVMDDYFTPQDALPYAERALEQLPESLTVAVVHALISAQVAMDEDWDPIWDLIDTTLNDEGLNGDMRVGAIHIIVEYMQLYE